MLPTHPLHRGQKTTLEPLLRARTPGRTFCRVLLTTACLLLNAAVCLATSSTLYRVRVNSYRGGSWQYTYITTSNSGATVDFESGTTFDIVIYRNSDGTAPFDFKLTPPGQAELKQTFNTATSAGWYSLSAAGTYKAQIDTTAAVTFTMRTTCAYTVSPKTVSPIVSGQTVNIGVTTTPAGCPWTASESESWMTITSGSSGSGNGTVVLSVSPNPTGYARPATVTVAGQSVSVTQAYCTVSYSSTFDTAPNSGKAGSFTVSGPSGCPWVATSDSSWLTITSGASGTSTGTITYSAAANPTGVTRVGIISGTRGTFTLTQGCSYAVSSTNVSAIASGQPVNIGVTAPAGCAWSASESADWISITSGASGSGNGTVVVSVSPNATGNTRSATVTVAGHGVNVTQSPCEVTYDPTSDTAPAAGKTGYITVRGPSGCPWVATSDSPWLTITSGASGTSTGTITYGVAANTGPPRAGTIFGTKASFSLSQAGASSTMRMTVQNAADGSATSWTGATCRLFETDFTYVTGQDVTADAQHVCAWTDLAVGTYRVQVWTPGTTPFAGEYWGYTEPQTVNPRGALTFSWARSMPHGVRVEFRKDSEFGTLLDQGSEVLVGTTVWVRVLVTQQTPETYRSSKVRVLLDRDRAAPYDADSGQTSYQSVPTGGTGAWFTRTFIVSQPGEYSAAVDVLTEVDGAAIRTDGWTWFGGFRVTRGDLVTTLYGRPVPGEGGWVSLFDKTYTVYGLRRDQSEPIIHLPFEGSDPAASESTLVKDAELGDLVLAMWAFSEALFNPDNDKTYLTEVEQNYGRATWWDPRDYVLPSKRLRIAVGQTALWGANEVAKAMATGGASFVGSLGGFAALVVDQLSAKYPEDLVRQQIQALTVASGRYGEQLDSYNSLLKALQFPNLAQYVKLGSLGREALRTSGTYSALQADAAKALVGGDRGAYLTRQGLALDELSGFATGLAWDYATHLLSEAAGGQALNDELKLATHLIDAHVEAVRVTADNLLREGARIQELAGLTDSASARIELAHLLDVYAWEYAELLPSLALEDMCVQLTHMQNVRNINSLSGAFLGANARNISILTDRHRDLQSMVTDEHARYSAYLLGVEQARTALAAALETISVQRSDELLAFELVSPPKVFLNPLSSETTGLVLRFTNKYSGHLVVTDVLSGESRGGISFSSRARPQIAPNATAEMTLDMTVPPHWYTLEQEKGHSVGVELPILWTVDGNPHTAVFRFDVTVCPHGEFTGVTTDRASYRPGDVAIVRVGYEGSVATNPEVVGYLLKPNGERFQVSWGANELHFPMGAGPYGPYGVEFFLKQTPGNVALPTSFALGRFHLLPPVAGPLELVGRTSVRIIYVQADFDVADDIRNLLGLSEDAMIEVSSTALPELKTIAAANNTVLVGGPSVNPLVETLVQLGRLTVTLDSPGDAIVQAVPGAFGTSDSIVVAGFRLADTQVAAVSLLREWSSTRSPVVSGLIPASAASGSGAFTLLLTGAEFVKGSSVHWNGTARPTTFVSTTQLAAEIPASDVVTSGSAIVTVFTPSPGGGTSNALTFTITAPNPVPTITGLNPSSVTPGSPAFTLTVNGTGFTAGSKVRWNGIERATTYVSPTRLTVAVAAGDVASTGTANVTVFTPAPGGGTSNAFVFTTTGSNPKPTLSSLQPAQVAAGSPAFTLTVVGTGFVPASTVRWNKSGRPTTYISATQLTAAISATDVAKTGTVTITVNTPSPGGGTSKGLTFTVAARSSTTADFDGDAKADPAVYRTTDGTWFWLRSTDNLTTYESRSMDAQAASHVPVPGDYDGDGLVDPASFDAEAGNWTVLRSSTRYLDSAEWSLGAADDLVAQADYDGDAVTDAAVYRPATGEWLVRLSSDPSAVRSVMLGEADDLPVPADYDGDGAADVAVYRPSTGAWLVLTSSSEYRVQLSGELGKQPYGDVPVPGDYDGDARADMAVFRPESGTWFVLESSSPRGKVASWSWGQPGDVPMPGDYDGDQITDLAVYRPSTGEWFVRPSSNPAAAQQVVFGGKGDAPLHVRK